MKTNPFAEKLKQENLTRKLNTEKSVKQVKDSLWRGNGRELVEEKSHFIDYALPIITLTLLVLAVHEFIIKP